MGRHITFLRRKGSLLLLFLVQSFSVHFNACAVNAQAMYVDSSSHFDDLTVHAPVSLCETGLSGSVTGQPGVTRIRIPGQSRVTDIDKIFSVAKVKVALAPDQKCYRPKIDICLHWNLSLPAGECRPDQWRAMEKGGWTATISPFETRVLDIRSSDASFCGVLLSMEEEFQPFRVVFLVIGGVLILVAPILGTWVPFYYTSGMTIGILLIILFLLFQSMKLLPTGRKSSFYVLFYGCLLGAGTLLLSYLTAAAQAGLHAMGLGEDLVGPVVVFLLAALFLVGAGLGFWIVRKFILMPNGTPDRQTALFITWALRGMGVVFCFLSSIDSVLALCCPLLLLTLNSLLHRMHFTSLLSYLATMFRKPKEVVKEDVISEEEVPTTPLRESISRSRALFVDGSQPEVGRLSPGERPFYRMKSDEGMADILRHHYSSIHNRNIREVLSPQEAAEISRQCTEKAEADLYASPMFATWLLEACKEKRVLVNVAKGEDVTRELSNAEIEEELEDDF